jgi:hypothetical protein
LWRGVGFRHSFLDLSVFGEFELSSVYERGEGGEDEGFKARVGEEREVIGAFKSGGATMKERREITIEIVNITEAQELAIRDFLAAWGYLGGVGSSRWTSFYADGDGDFRPKILVNGEKPQQYGSKSEIENRWRSDEYRIDFDEISGSLRESRDGK